MKLNYAQWTKRAMMLATVNTEPSETDQTGAEDTDINVIVKRYGVYGTMPSGTKPPQFGQDMSEIPTDLRSLIETARSVERLRGELPPQFRNLSIEELISYTPETIADMLKPPEQKPPVGETR